MDFIRAQLELILSEEFLAAEYKRKRNEYFLKIHKGSKQGVPSNKEIASEAIRYLIKIGTINSDSGLHEILQLPFFSKYVRNPTPHYDYLRAMRREKSTFDVSGIADLERAQRKLTEMKESMILEAQSEIDEAIAKKKDEYYALPSILDEVNPPEPEIIDEVVEDEERYTPWWKKLNLVADPFPTVDGLQMIPKEFHDKIVYKTDLFSEFAHHSRETPEELFRNTIVFGEFGAGKTTLFEYLNKVIWESGISAILLQVYTESNIHTQIIRFRQELARSLGTILTGTIDERITAGTFQDIDQQIVELLRSHSRKSSTNGIIVFIDDLHKNIAGVEVSLEFLNYLQTFTSKLNNSLDGFRVTFYVAGSLQWKNAIDSEARYSGSLPRRVTIPPISSMDAYSMLNQRLEAFDPNPELKREFKRESIDRVYSILKQAKLPLTFRSFISKAVEDFQNGNFDILTADPIHIPTATLKSVRKMFDSNPKIGPALNELLKNVKKPLNRREVLRVLIRLFLRVKIPETDSVFIDKQFFFKQLIKLGLIQKMRDKNHGFVWVINPELLSINNKVVNMFSVSLENYLLALYGFSKKQPVAAGEELDLVDRLISASENDALRRMLSQVKEMHSQIVTAQIDHEARVMPKVLRNLCLKSLETLSQAYFTHIDTFDVQIQPLRTRTKYWFSPHEVGQFLDSVKGLEQLDDRIWYIVNMYRQTFAAITNFVLRQLTRTELFPIGSRDLTRKESVDLASITNEWMNGSYVDSVGGLRLLLEKRTSRFLYNTFLLLYGEFDNRILHCPEKMRKRLSDAFLPETQNKFGIEEHNEFNSLRLAEIASIIAGDETTSWDNWRNVFIVVFEPIEREKFYETLVQIDTLCKVKGWNEEKVEELRILVWDATDYLRQMNTSYLELLRRGVFVVGKGASREIYIGMNADLIGGLDPIDFDCDMAERVLNSLSKERIPLDDPQFIQSSLGCSYRFFFALVGLGFQDLLDKVCPLKKRIAFLYPRESSLALEVVSKERRSKKKTESADSMSEKLTPDWSVDPTFVADHVGRCKEEPLIEVKTQIDISSDKGKAEFVRDMIALANRCLRDSTRGLLLVGPRLKDGFGQQEFEDDSIYQNIIGSWVVPRIEFLFKSVDYRGIIYGAFIIQPQGDKPFAAKKFIIKDGKVLIKEGQCWVREGTEKGSPLNTEGIIELSKRIADAAAARRTR